MNLRASKVRPELWPDAYLDDSFETCFKFVLNCCWTFDEETSRVTQIPPHPQVEFIAGLWYESRRTGKPLCLEASRRILKSWVARGCRVWAMGLKPEMCVIAGPTLPKAADHTWRIAWLFRQARERLWPHLADCSTRATQDGGYDEHRCKSVVLPNGSVMQSLNQQSETFQGSGYAAIDLEELSLYRRPAKMWGQAQTITAGRADTIGGHVVAIVNASDNAEWHSIKKLQKVVANHDPSWSPLVAASE